MQTITVGPHRFSRVICGTNAFHGRSHFSAARDAEYRSRFDDAMIERTLRVCLGHGVDTVESSAGGRIEAILDRVQAQAGRPLRFVGSTRIDDTSELKTHERKLAHLIERRADICVVHAQWLEHPRQPLPPDGLREIVGRIHAAGLLAAISAHRVATVERCEREGCGVDIYLFPLNATGFVYPGYDGGETVAERIDLVRRVPRPFILMKALGAGRIPPAEGLRFIAQHAKPTDLVLIGFASEEEANETLALATQVL
ncbi:MAG: hypothetical protein FJ399_15485 [Verrucomicrobia bacterium]|nr:hypothetical protein [Verrucomicrobiota bacterium]